jgi:hypothetical protein
MIFDNHQPLPQYAERDPTKEQRRCDTADQPTRYRYPLPPFLETQFARKLDDPHQRDATKYLEDANSSEHEVKKISGKLKKGLKKTHISDARTLTR